MQYDHSKAKAIGTIKGCIVKRSSLITKGKAIVYQQARIGQ